MLNTLARVVVLAVALGASLVGAGKSRLPPRSLRKTTRRPDPAEQERQLLDKRASAQCNSARARIVGALRDTGKSVDKIQDAQVKSAAQAGLDQANGGVADIAKSIVKGQDPPADSRDTVAAGLKATNDALGSGKSGDAAVAAAQKSVGEAAAAGQDVLDQC
ncbi:hypothetical protein CDD83_3881 [Cordyceps sp. RAO-2017]|nr:hypothetical protein CDD83_3881 [Cordyceps sp. RAO-2017]